MIKGYPHDSGNIGGGNSIYPHLAGGFDFDRLLHPVGISTLQDVT